LEELAKVVDLLKEQAKAMALLEELAKVLELLKEQGKAVDP
jgi:hypothetical protein